MRSCASRGDARFCTRPAGVEGVPRFIEVVDTWGQPSAWLGGTNDLYPKTLAYAVDDRQAPLVCFHLWNRIEPTPESPVAGAFPQPMLLAVRQGAGRFEETLTFTPEGLRRRPHA